MKQERNELPQVCEAKYTLQIGQTIIPEGLHVLITQATINKTAWCCVHIVCTNQIFMLPAEDKKHFRRVIDLAD